MDPLNCLAKFVRCICNFFYVWQTFTTLSLSCKTDHDLNEITRLKKSYI